MTTQSTTDETVAELQRTAQELRADLEHLRRSLASEVRTRRLVVVEEDGFARLVASGTGIPEGRRARLRPPPAQARQRRMTSVAL